MAIRFLVITNSVDAVAAAPAGAGAGAGAAAACGCCRGYGAPDGHAVDEIDDELTNPDREDVSCVLQRCEMELSQFHGCCDASGRFPRLAGCTAGAGFALWLHRQRGAHRRHDRTGTSTIGSNKEKRRHRLSEWLHSTSCLIVISVVRNNASH